MVQQEKLDKVHADMQNINNLAVGRLLPFAHSRLARLSDYIKNNVKQVITNNE